MERIDGRIVHDVYLDRVVFRETFTGDGYSKTFTLDGSVGNATFKYGSWAIENVKTTLPAHITKTNKKPAYDSLIPLTRNRISVSSINATSGLVTLDYAPRNGIDFYVWYWYALPNHHLLEDYYREDFVSSIEDEATAYGVDISVDTTSFTGTLSGADTTVQKAFDTVDDHAHNDRYYTETELSSQTAGSEGSRLIGFHTHNLHDHLIHITNSGLMEGCVISDAGALNVTWTSGMVWDSDNQVTMSISSGSAMCDNNAVNYVYSDYSVSTTILQRGTTYPVGTDQVVIGIVWCQDNDIWKIEQRRYMNTSLAELRRSNMILFPSRVVSGMSVSEDTNVDNALDVMMSAGSLLYGNQLYENVSQINSRTTEMVRHFHASSAWDTDTSTVIDTANYDNGTAKTDCAGGKWFKSVFLYVNGKIHWVYPTVQYATRAQANAGPIPAIPPGLARAAYLTAIVHGTDAADFTNTDWIDIRVGLAQTIASAPVTDHGYLAGLEDDDHTQYILKSTFDADTFLYASSDNTPVATSPANAMAAFSGHADTAFSFNGQAVTGGTYNAITLAAETAGFSVAGGTTAKTLTVDETFVTSTQLSAIGANTSKVTESTAIVAPLSMEGYTISIPAATNAAAGYATAAHIQAIEANTLKNTNVSTTLEVGTVGVDTVAITSDGGVDDVTLPAATIDTAGMLTTAKWAEIVANTAKVSGVDFATAAVLGTL